MSALLNPQPARARFQHATEEEYGAFVRQRQDIRCGSNLLSAYRRFIRHYPDLDEWFSAPLAERVGQRKVRSGHACVSALARPYLYYLARSCRVSFDWEWIIAVGFHVLPQELLPPTVCAFIRESVDKAVQLGYGRKSATSKLSRTMKALYLHGLEPGVTEAAEAGINELERAIIAFGERPDVAKFFTSAEAYRRQALSYRQALYTLRVVLYHRGQLPAPPERTAARPKRQSLRPRMEALVERYLWARQVQHARPATVAKIGGDVRRFISWLARTHPKVESFTEVTREQVLDYAASLDAALSPQSGRPLSLESKLTRLSSLSVFFQDATAWG